MSTPGGNLREAMIWKIISGNADTTGITGIRKFLGSMNASMSEIGQYMTAMDGRAAYYLWNATGGLSHDMT